MTPARTGGRRGGHFEIERTIKGVKLRLSSGTSDIKRFHRIVAILEKLGENDQIDTLRAVAAKHVSIAELVDADRRDRTGLTLQRVKLRAFLWDREVAGAVEVGAVSRALARVPGAKTRKRYLVSFLALMRKGARWLPVDARVEDLAALPWQDLAGLWGGSGADWMHLRRAVSRFLTLHMGDKWDEFARKTRQQLPYKKVKKRRPTLAPAQFLAIVSRAPAHAAAAFWCLAITGVRVNEYLSSTPALLDDATRTYTPPAALKNDVGEFPLRVDARLWPYVKAAIPSRLGYAWLNRHWHRACAAAGVVGGRAGVTLHDLRHCHGQWAINAGIAESKVQGSLRHENPAQTRDYTMQAGTVDVSSALADVLLPVRKAPRRRRA